MSLQNSNHCDSQGSNGGDDYVDFHDHAGESQPAEGSCTYSPSITINEQ